MDTRTLRLYGAMTARYLFGCHHRHISRVFTIEGESYRVCLDCGSRFAYSLRTMSMKGHEVPNPLYELCCAATKAAQTIVSAQVLRAWHSILHWGSGWAKGRA